MQITKTITVTLLDKTMNFTDTEYSDFLNSLQTFLKSEGRGCSGKCHDHDTREFDHVADAPDPLVELNPEIEFEGERFFLLTKSPHKAIQAEAMQGPVLYLDVDSIVDKMVAQIDKVGDQMDTEVLKDKVEAMEAPKKSGRPSKTEKDRKPLKKDAAVPPLDPEMEQIRKLAADKYGLAWTDAKRIWCLGSDLTKEQVASVVPKANPAMAWWFYRDCHKGVEA